MSAANSPKVGGSDSQDVFLPGVREGFNKRFPTDDFQMSEESDFGIDPSDIVLLDQLARGAYGVVYKGVIRGKTYAIKVQEEVPAQEEQVNILVELSLLKTLKHERLVASSGSARIIEKRSPFEVKIMIAMELCDNGALRECLARNLSWDLRIRIALDVIEGINYMHDNKIVHRDIKTTNILITSDWRAKVCDFSFACHIENLSKHDYVYGTDEFMAPEIALGEDFGTAADIFSYGIVLAEMISGQEPSATFLRRSARDLFALDEEELKAAVLPECPDSMEALTLMCCEKEGEFRITAAEVFDWLQALLEERVANSADIVLPEKEANDFSNVVSPIREGTVVYPKTDEAHLIRYKSINTAAVNAIGAISFMKRAAGRSKSMNATPSREGALDPAEAVTPLEREKLQFGDISAPVSHSGFFTYGGKLDSSNDAKDSAADTRPLVSPVNTAPAVSLSSMVSRVAYLELQIQELKAENKSLTRGVSALVMMSEEMKRASKEPFSDIDGGHLGNKKKSPRGTSPRGTPTSAQSETYRKLMTHRKSRSADATPFQLSPKALANDGTDIADSKHRTPIPPPPPTAQRNDTSSVAVDVAEEATPEGMDRPRRSFAELKQNLQTFVHSGQFSKSSVHMDSAAIAEEANSPGALASTPSFDAKKGPPGAMKLFGIGNSFEKKLRKVSDASSPSPINSPTDQPVNPYDKSRLRSVPPPPPKSGTSGVSPQVPPPPPVRSSVTEAPLFSEAQLAVINEMISQAVSKERAEAKEKYSAIIGARLTKEKKVILDIVDEKISELKHSLNSSPPAAAGKSPQQLARNMSVSFGGVYREMFDEGKPKYRNVSNDNGTDEKADGDKNIGDDDEKDVVVVDVDNTAPSAVVEADMPKASEALGYLQQEQLSKLGGQVEVILSALRNLTLPGVIHLNKDTDEKEPAEKSSSPPDVEDDNQDDGYYNQPQHEDDSLGLSRYPHRHALPGLYTNYDNMGPTSPIRESTSSGSYEHYSHDGMYHDDFSRSQSRSSPEPQRSPLARDIVLGKGNAHGDLANAFRSFMNVVNHADDGTGAHQSKSEYEAGIRPGYYDLNGRPVVDRMSPQPAPGHSPVTGGQRQRHVDVLHSHHPSQSTTPASRRSVVVSTPLSASITWRDVGSGGTTPPTSDSKKRSPASAGRVQQSNRSGRSSSKRGNNGPGGSKYNQIGTRGTPRDSEVDSSIAANFFRMHNTGNSLGKEEVAIQRNSPKSAGSASGRRGPGGGSNPAQSPVSLRQILGDK